MYRTAVSRSYAALAVRPFSTSPVARKTATEKVSEVADKVNKTLGKGLASAIETGERATEKTKETVAGTKGEAAKKADHVKDMADKKKDKANAHLKETKEQVKETKDQVKDAVQK